MQSPTDGAKRQGPRAARTPGGARRFRGGEHRQGCWCPRKPCLSARRRRFRPEDPATSAIPGGSLRLSHRRCDPEGGIPPGDERHQAPCGFLLQPEISGISHFSARDASPDEADCRQYRWLFSRIQLTHISKYGQARKQSAQTGPAEFAGGFRLRIYRGSTVENANSVRELNVSPGRRIVEGKSG